MKALVVDDSSVMRRIHIKALAQAGIHEVDQAVDGKQALQKVEQNQYDLILMDWNLPNLSGVEAVKTIRSQGLDIPIIMISSNMKKTRIIEALEAGATYYFIKPYKQDEFLDKLRKIMENQS